MAQFMLSGVVAGPEGNEITYTVTASAEGYLSQSEDVTVIHGDDQTVAFSLVQGTEGCDVAWDMNGDCVVDNEDSKLLKQQQKEQKTELKDQQKADKDAMKTAMGSTVECGTGWDLDGNCVVDKDDSKLLKEQQKDQKAELKAQQKADKDAMKAAQQ